MGKISVHLWYDNKAKEAAEMYVKIFGENSKINSVNTLNDTPSGKVEMVDFEILGFTFSSISAGPLFKFNPAISFHVICNNIEKVDEYYNKLIDGGKALMELGEYPFSKRYGWVQDKFGLTWQLIYTEQTPAQRITPVLMFTQEKVGMAESAVKYYTEVFKDSEVRSISPQYSDISILGVKFGAMDSPGEHNFTFNEAISIMVACKDQAEVDYYWEKLSAVPEAEQCGWLKDKYGISWQIIPTAMGEMMGRGTPEQIGRVTQAFLKMKKFEIAELEKAFEG